MRGEASKARNPTARDGAAERRSKRRVWERLLLYSNTSPIPVIVAHWISAMCFCHLPSSISYLHPMGPMLVLLSIPGYVPTSFCRVHIGLDIFADHMIMAFVLSRSGSCEESFGPSDENRTVRERERQVSRRYVGS